MSNGRPLDIMSIGKVVQWCSMDPMDPFPMFNGHVQWIQWMSKMDPSEWIQWAPSQNLVWRVNISLVFLSYVSIVSDGSIVSFGSIKHYWTLGRFKKHFFARKNFRQ